MKLVAAVLGLLLSCTMLAQAQPFVPAGPIPRAEKGIANGVTPLGPDDKVPLQYLPSLGAYSPLTSGHIFVGGPNNTPADVPMSGDCTIAYPGVVVCPKADTALQPQNNLSDLQNLATARMNLGAAASGVNSDITALLGLTTPLALGEGGTGSAAPFGTGPGQFMPGNQAAGGDIRGTLDNAQVLAAGRNTMYVTDAKCDVQVFATISGAMTAGSNLFTRSDGGSFTTADIGKIVWIPGAKAGGDTLVAAIASYVGPTQVRLAADADLSTSLRYMVTRVDDHFPGSFPVADPPDGDGIPGHNYAPNDTVTLTAANVGDIGATLVVSRTQLGGDGTHYTIVNGGTGGVNGRGYVTGTKGEGFPFELWVTIAGGSIVSIDGIKRVGTYNINPADPSNEPVSGAGLTGAVVAVSMGVKDAWVQKQGSYASQAGLGTFTSNYGYVVGQSASSGTGVGAQWYAIAGIGAEATYGRWGYGTDDTTVIQSAINTVGASGGGNVALPHGNCGLTFTLANTQNNVMVVGAGLGSLRAGPSYLSSRFIGAVPGNQSTEATNLVWFGPRGGTGWKSEAATGSYFVRGGGLWEVEFIGLSSMGIGVQTFSHSGAKWRFGVENTIIESVDIEESKHLISPTDVSCTQFNYYDYISVENVQARSSWNSGGVLIRGSALCDWSGNHIRDIHAVTGLQVPLDISNSDSNRIDEKFAWAASTRIRCTVYRRANLWIDGNGVSQLGVPARSLSIGIDVCPGRADFGGDYAETGSGRILIEDLDIQGNGTPSPTLEPGAQLAWQTSVQAAPGSNSVVSNSQINCNGNGEIDQAHEGAPVTAINSQAMDCWKHSSAGTVNAYISAQRISNPSNLISEFADTFIRLSSTGIEAPSAGVRREFCTTFDAGDLRNVGFGSTRLPDRPEGPKSINLSFMARASNAGGWSWNFRAPNRGRTMANQFFFQGTASQHQTIVASSLVTGGSNYHAGEDLLLATGRADVGGLSAVLEIDTVDVNGSMLTYHFVVTGTYPPNGLPSSPTGLLDAGTPLGSFVRVAGSGASINLTLASDGAPPLTGWQNFSFSFFPDADVASGVVQTDWPKTPGLEGAELCFDTGSGSAFSNNTFPGQWSTGTTVVPHSNSLVTLTGGILDLTSVRVWIGQNGSAPVVPRPIGEELMLVQRRFRKTLPPGVAPAQNVGGLTPFAGALCDYARSANSRPAAQWRFDPPMVAPPVITTYNPGAANDSWRVASGTDAGTDIPISVDPSTALSANGAQIVGTGTMATIGDNACVHATADARF